MHNGDGSSRPPASAALARRRAAPGGAADRTGRTASRPSRCWPAPRAPGIAEAEYRVGRCYLEGTGVPPSRTEGARWLERAANQGYVEAQAQLADPGDPRADRGVGAAGLGAPGCSPPPRRQRRTSRPASRWARKAAEGGSADGQAVLGYILTSGPEPMRDPDEAHRWYERSAAAGCPQGALGYALSLARDGDRRRSSRRRWRRICAGRRTPDCRPRSICSA